MMRAVLISTYLLLFILPFISHAQQDNREDVLRAEIYVAIMADPRTADLSEEEISQLVESLANEIVAQGVADEYVPPVVTFSTETYPSGYTVYGVQLSETTLYVLVLLGLAAAIALLKHLVDDHRKRIALS